MNKIILLFLLFVNIFPVYSKSLLNVELKSLKQTYKEGEEVKLLWKLENKSEYILLINSNFKEEIMEPFYFIGEKMVWDTEPLDIMLSSYYLALCKNGKIMWETGTKYNKFLPPDTSEIPSFNTYPLFLYPGMSIEQEVNLNKTNTGFMVGGMKLSPGKYSAYFVFVIRDYWKDRLLKRLINLNKSGLKIPFCFHKMQIGDHKIPILPFYGVVISNKVYFEVVK